MVLSFGVIVQLAINVSFLRVSQTHMSQHVQNDDLGTVARIGPK